MYETVSVYFPGATPDSVNWPSLSETALGPLGCNSTRAPRKTAWVVSVTRPVTVLLCSCALSNKGRSATQRKASKTADKQDLRMTQTSNDASLSHDSSDAEVPSDKSASARNRAQKRGW